MSLQLIPTSFSQIQEFPWRKSISVESSYSGAAMRECTPLRGQSEMELSSILTRLESLEVAREVMRQRIKACARYSLVGIVILGVVILVAGILGLHSIIN